MSGLRGGLDLVAALDRSGRVFLRRQSFSPPIHISKPHHDAGWLVVNLASPSPGLLEGDCVTARVVVERGARLMLTAPSANRVHATPSGFAELQQEYCVEADGALDVWPEYLIPQAGARYFQNTMLRVATGGTLLWTESMAPGRVARGEVFAFAEVHLSTDLFVGERHVLRERYALTPATVVTLRKVFSTAYYASIVFVSPALEKSSAALRELTETYATNEVWVGATQLCANAWAIKIVAADSPTLRTTVVQVRSALYRILGCNSADLRRTTGNVNRPPAQ